MTDLAEILRVLRDAALVVLALEAIVLSIAALILVVQFWRLLGTARRHLEQLTTLATDVLNMTAETARSVRGTTTFVGNHAARPVIELVAALAAASHFARAVFSSDLKEEGGGRR